MPALLSTSGEEVLTILQALQASPGESPLCALSDRRFSLAVMTLAMRTETMMEGNNTAVFTLVLD
jgi:hypothetical protein